MQGKYKTCLKVQLDISFVLASSLPLQLSLSSSSSLSLSLSLTRVNNFGVEEHSLRFSHLSFSISLLLTHGHFISSVLTGCFCD